MSDAIHRLFSGRQWHEVHTIDGLRYRMTIQVTPEYKAKLDSALSHAAGQEAPINPAEIDRKLVGGEAVAWRTIKPCGLRRHMTQAQYDANPSVQKWYEPFKCADCRAPAQPPASAEAVDLLRRTVLAFRYVYDETCTAGVLRADIERYLAASSGRKGHEMP